MNRKDQKLTSACRHQKRQPMGSTVSKGAAGRRGHRQPEGEEALARGAVHEHARLDGVRGEERGRGLERRLARPEHEHLLPPG